MTHPPTSQIISALRFVILRLGRGCLWMAFILAGTARAQQNNAKIKLEYRLLEMPTVQADEVIATMVRWSANPVMQGRLLAKQLWNDALKPKASLETDIFNGVRRASPAPGPELPWLPTGASAQGWTGRSVRPGAEVEMEAVLGTGDLANFVDINIAFGHVLLQNPVCTQIRCQNSAIGFNGIPFLLGRRDLGGRAEVLVARASWFDPGASEQLLGKPISQLYVRTRLLHVPKTLAPEAARRFPNQPDFVQWLIQQCSVPATACIVSSKSGQSMRVEFATEDQLPTGKQGFAAWQPHLISGIKTRIDAILGADGRTLEVASLISCCVQQQDAGARHAAIAGREFELAAAKPFILRLGKPVALRCSEWLPPGRPRAESKLVDSPDVYLVMDAFWPGK